MIFLSGIDPIAKFAFCGGLRPAVSVVEVTLSNGEFLEEFLQFLRYGVDTFAVGHIVAVTFVAQVFFHTYDTRAGIAALDKELIVLRAIHQRLQRCITGILYADDAVCAIRVEGDFLVFVVGKETVTPSQLCKQNGAIGFAIFVYQVVIAIIRVQGKDATVENIDLVGDLHFRIGESAYDIAFVDVAAALKTFLVGDDDGTVALIVGIFVIADKSDNKGDGNGINAVFVSSCDSEGVHSADVLDRKSVV